jgi:NADPH:quinone reductase
MKEQRNRVVQLRGFGGPEELDMVDALLPTAGRAEVRVRVLASSVEYTDVPIRRHLYPQTMSRRPPLVLGYDLVGEIDQLGDDVSGVQLGDRVADMTVLERRLLHASGRPPDPRRPGAWRLPSVVLDFWTSAYQAIDD